MNEGNTQTRTLMSSLEILNENVRQLEKLLNLSEKLVDKFERTENDLKKGSAEIDSGYEKQQNIVGLFYGANERIVVLMNKIETNVEKVISMID